MNRFGLGATGMKLDTSWMIALLDWFDFREN